MRVLAPPLLAALVPFVPAQQEPKVDLKVLYAGVPGHARTEQWREFLAKHTAGVTVTDVKQLADGAGADADVVILDCPDPIVKNAEGRPERIAVPKPAGLTTAFARPTIVVGSMAMITDGLHLKSNWL
jgi:hypothetical protein